MELSMTLFGNLQIHLDDQLLHLPTQRSRALLAYVVLNSNQRQPRPQLAALLWPESATAQANLRGELPRLRKAIAGDSPSTAAALRVDRGHVTFDAGQATVDVLRFQELIAQCEGHQHGSISQCAVCCQRLVEAISLYQDDLLEDLFLDDSPSFEEWLLFMREYLHRQATDALETLLDHFEATDQYEQVCLYARRQLEMLPWRERTHRRLMRALAHTGHRHAALTQFKRCQRILDQELAVEPEARTLQLAQAIQIGALSFQNGRTDGVDNSLDSCVFGMD